MSIKYNIFAGGMGKRKIKDYGEEILLILENFYDVLKPL